MLARLAPLLFVLLWSTGFLGAKFGMPHAAPLAFLLVRYLAVIALMTTLALALRAPWPRDGRHWFHIGVSGLLVHGLYLSGVFMAIGAGLPAGVASLVVGMQPLLTATVAGWLLGETIVRRQWLGLALGFIGVTMVLSNKLGAAFGLDALWPAIAALLGITAGTLYQKKFCPRFDWRTGAVAQFVPTAIVTAFIVFACDDFRIDWTGEFVFALGWLVLVLSIGAISLLNWLIRHGSAVNVASLFYLTPPTTALLAWLFFGESLTGAALIGMALAVLGVYLSRR
jgi:drug/metabolite transporter (DMT)-like permease